MFSTVGMALAGVLTKVINFPIYSEGGSIAENSSLLVLYPMKRSETLSEFRN